MALINKRNRCGIPMSSTCVGYEGAYGGVLKEEDFTCDVRLDDIVYKLSTVIKDLDASKNISITELKDNITNIKKDIEFLKLQDIYITMDLGCLTTDAKPCEVSPKKYSIKTILEIFKNELCLLKS